MMFLVELLNRYFRELSMAGMAAVLLADYRPSRSFRGPLSRAGQGRKRHKNVQPVGTVYSFDNDG